MAQLKDLVVLGKSRFIGDLYANKIVGTIEGKISDADRATSDALDQNIASTYIKNITADGKTITFTKGDGTFASFDTQDTTYAQATADTLGLVRVVGSTGTSTTDVMSQKAVTDALNNIQPEVSNAFVDATLAKDNTGVRRLNFTRGNGSTVEYDLSFAQATDSVLGLVKVTGSTGTSTIDVMSQKAVTDALSNIHVDNTLTEVNLTKDNTGTRVLTFTKGDGSTADYDLSFAQATDSVLGLVKVQGSTGTSTTDVMSQKAVSDELGTKVESVSMTKQDNTRKLTFTKGNGTTSEYDLSYNQATDSILGLVKVTGSTGTSTTDVMSQKAVTDVVNDKLESVSLSKDNTGSRVLTFTKGDGSTAEYDLSFAQATDSVLGLVKVNGSTGTSTTDVMSQKAVTDELSSLDTRLTPIENISSNFTIENGKLCYIASDGTNSGDNSNGTAEPLTLDETLQDIANTLGDISQNVTNVSAATAAQTTTDWLNQHVDPSRDVVIDDSLTISGAAADAKVTGDNVRELKSDLNDVDDAIGTYNVNLTVTRYDSACYWNAESTTAVLTNYNNYRAYEPIPVTPGQTYYSRIWVASSAKQHPILFVDENYLILSYYDYAEVGYHNFENMVAPEGAVYALLTSYKEVTEPTFYYKELNSVPNLMSRVDTLETQYWDLFKDKNVVILGDSISTNGNPESGDYPNTVEITITAEDVGVELSAYLTYYDVQASLSLGGHTFTSEEIGTEVTFIPISDDVGKVIGLPNNYNNNNRKTWWEVAMDAFDFNPIPVCWSGASVTSHEETDLEYKTSYAWHPAQIRKCGIRTAGTMERTAPDVIIIYRGVNDFSHMPYTKLTEGYFDSENWTYPVTDEIASGYGYKEGLCLTIKKLREAYPNATIYLCTLNVFKRVSYADFPTRNGYNTLPEYNNAIREVADYMGCPVIEFDKDGITFENCYSGGYITDSSTKPTHPSDKGHAVMGKKAIADIKASYSPL